jgi:hypothetical protein
MQNLDLARSAEGESVMTSVTEPVGDARATFRAAVGRLSEAIGDRPLDRALQDWLNTQFATGSEMARALTTAIETGDVDGWLLPREAGGIRFGRPVKPGDIAGRFSVDVVRMTEMRGPHHIHPQGEIGFVVPIEGTPKFDGFPGPWYVYPPGSDHHPTITGGSAYVLYLLPEGAITFTGR